MHCIYYRQIICLVCVIRELRIYFELNNIKSQTVVIVISTMLDDNGGKQGHEFGSQLHYQECGEFFETVSDRATWDIQFQIVSIPRLRSRTYNYF